jgi:hypothetical protein
MEDERPSAMGSASEDRPATEEMPGLALAMNASAFLRAAETLHDSDPSGWGWVACYVNIGFAVELALKAYLREKGGSEKLQKRLGHDLVAAYSEAVQRGYSPSDDLQSLLVRDVSPSFQDMSVRYGTFGWIELPAIEAALWVARGLVEDVWKQSCLVLPRTQFR